MIVRQFISWIRSASASERAEATRLLARAWLYSDLLDDDRNAAEAGLLMLLDDSSPLVRQAMSDVFARSAEAPAAIVQALAKDQFSVAQPVVEHSPLLLDSDLVDLVATGDSRTQCAIARRRHLPPPVCAAIAEVGTAASALELIENPHAELAPFSWDRIVGRHGHLAAIRESMLSLEGLPPATRLALIKKLTETLTKYVVSRNWLSADRAIHLVDETSDRCAVDVAVSCRASDMRALVRHLRETDHLTPGLILRALLSSNFDLFNQAMIELSGLSEQRVLALIYDRGGIGVTALLMRAGLPETTYPAIVAALDAVHEAGFVDTEDSAVGLRRRMVERVLTQCEDDPAASEPLLILLRRFATESAREQARAFLEDLSDEEQHLELSARLDRMAA